jgi:hypothetical protein
MIRGLAVAVFIVSVGAGALVMIGRAKGSSAQRVLLNAQPPKSIVICGIKDHPCVTYALSYHSPTEKFGDAAGEGSTDYDAKTISIAWSKDPVTNVQALEHEVYHAALWERGFRDTDMWDIHAWIYFSEGPFSMVLHDNPNLVRYIVNGY